MLKIIKKYRNQIIKYGILFAVYIILVLFMRANINKFIDSDASSELILAQILKNNGGILTNQWYYSTELRVINTQIVYSLMFRIFNNWHQVRVIGNAVLYMCMLISAFYFSKGAKITNYFPYIGIFLLFPLSDIYFINVLVGGYYITHITFSFLIIGSILYYLQLERVGYKVLITILTFGLSVLAGLGGIRLPFVLFAPLTLVVLTIYIRDYVGKGRGRKATEVEKKKKFGFVVGISDIGALIGYIINSRILSQNYSYKEFSDMKWKPISLDDLWGAVNGFLESWGYHTDVSFFSLFSVVNVLFFVIMGLIVWLCWKNRRNYLHLDFNSRIVILYFIIAVAFYSLFRMVSGYGIDRHNLSIAAFLIPAFCCFVTNQEYENKNRVKVKILMGLVTLNAVICYIAYGTSNGNQEKLQLADYLKYHSEYTQGYASFWNGNIMTELTNGKCQMWVWDDEKVGEEFEPFQWLQKKSHDLEEPDGKCFYLFSMEEYQSLPLAQKFNIEDAVYHTDQYVVFEGQNK